MSNTTINEPRQCQRPGVHIATGGYCWSDECPPSDPPPAEPEPVEFKISDLAKVVVFLAGVIMFGYFIIGYLSSGPTHDADWCRYQNNLVEVGSDNVDTEEFLKYCVNGSPEK